MGGVSLALRMTLFFLSFWGKYATAAGGGNRERVCGGGTERRAATQGDMFRSEAWAFGAKRRAHMLRRRKYRPAAARREA